MTVWKFHITIIVTKIIMVNHIIKVFVKCGDNLEKVLLIAQETYYMSVVGWLVGFYSIIFTNPSAQAGYDTGQFLSGV